MDEWLKPLPFETSISTLLGAILSFTFSQQKAVSAISSWKDAPRPISFFAIVLINIVLINIFCKGLALRKYGLVAAAGPGLIASIISVNIFWSSDFISPGEPILFTPDKFVVFTTLLLILWFLFSLTTTLVFVKIWSK